MKILTLFALLVLSTGLFASDSEKNVDGLTFVLHEDIWVQSGLENAKLQPSSAVVHGDMRWQSWHERGTTTLRKILALGPNVVFQVPSRDGEKRVFSVHGDQRLLSSQVFTDADNTTRALFGRALLVGKTMTRGDIGGDTSPSQP